MRMVLIVLAVIFFISFGITSYLVVSHRQKMVTLKQAQLQKIQNTPTPYPASYINTSVLPNAKKGVAYQGDIIASVKGSHQDLKITVTNLPEGLTLGDCRLKYDTTAISVPNTLAACSVKGIPVSAGEFQLDVTAKITNGLIDTKTSISLLVENQ